MSGEGQRPVTSVDVCAAPDEGVVEMYLTYGDDFIYIDLTPALAARLSSLLMAAVAEFER